MTESIRNIYSALQGNPAVWLCLTLVCYIVSQRLYKLSKFNPLATPIILTVAAIIAILLTFDIDYNTYFSGAGFIHFLLGPATVVLAVPLFEQRQKLARLWLPITGAILVGSTVSIVSVILLSWATGLSSQTMISLIPKSVTTPIAMGISAELGGLPDLTACLVVLTGILGSLIGKQLLKICRIQSDAVTGLTLGLSAHGMGTSAAFQISDRAGAFSGLAMGITGVVTAFLAPLLAIPLMKLFGL